MADLSLASQYTLILTDQNASTTEYLYNVTNAEPVFALDPNVTSTLKYNFCIGNPADSRCTDGATLYPTRFTNTVNGVSSSTNIADGLSYIDTRLRLRDRYGNVVNTGNIQIKYATPIHEIQSSLSDSSYFGTSFPGGAVIDSGTILMNMYDGTSISSVIPLTGQNIDYSFASFAPGNIDLEAILYNGVDL